MLHSLHQKQLHIILHFLVRLKKTNISTFSCKEHQKTRLTKLAIEKQITATFFHSTLYNRISFLLSQNSITYGVK